MTVYRLSVRLQKRTAGIRASSLWHRDLHRKCRLAGLGNKPSGYPAILQSRGAARPLRPARACDSAPRSWNGEVPGELLGVPAEFLDGGRLPMIGAQHRA